MGALLDDRALMEHGDFIAELAGRQSVGDIDGRFVAGDIIELGIDLRFCNGVKGRSWLV